MIIMMFMIFIMIVLSTSENPFKISFALMCLSTLTFSMIHENTGEFLLTLILMMLFVGGISLLFMVISSMFPNDKIKFKSNDFLVLVLVVPLAYLVHKSEIQSMMDIMSFTLKSYHFQSVVVVISLYFFSFLYCVGAEKMTLRSNSCLFFILL